MRSIQRAFALTVTALSSIPQRLGASLVTVIGVTTVMAVLVTMLALGEGLGISRKVLFDSLLDTPAVAPFLKSKRAKMDQGNYEAEFPLRWMQKDMHLATVSAYESGRLVPFVGSGLSVGACTTWPEMIRRLERCAFARPPRSTKKATPSMTRPSLSGSSTQSMARSITSTESLTSASRSPCGRRVKLSSASFTIQCETNYGRPKLGERLT